MGDGGLLFLYAFKLCYRSVRAKPVSGKTDPVCGINKRTLSFVEGTRIPEIVDNAGHEGAKAKGANTLSHARDTPR